MSQQSFSPENLIFIQSRADSNLALVDEYAQMMADGVVFDSIEDLQGEDGVIWVWDGYHRRRRGRG